MKIYTVDLTPSNPALIQFSSAKTDSSYVAIANGTLKDKAPSTFKLLNAVHKAMTGADLDPEESTVGASFNSGAFRAFYGPALCSKDGKILLQWGKEQIEFNLDGPLSLDVVDGVSVKLSFKFGNFNGMGEGLYLNAKFFLAAQDAGIVCNWGVRFPGDTPFKKEDLDAFEMYAEHDASKLCGLIGEPHVPSVILRMPQLPLGQYSVVGYSDDGKSMTLAPTSDGYYYRYENKAYNFDEDQAIDFEAGQVYRVWANSAVQPTLLAKPLISEEYPAELVVISVKPTKNGSMMANVAFSLHPEALSQLTQTQDEVPDFDL